MPTLTRTKRNPLQPLAGVITVAFRFAVLAAVARVVSALLGYGPIFGWSGGSAGYRGVCLNAPAELLQRSGALTNQALRLRPGASGEWTLTNICTAHVSTAQSLDAALTQVPSTLLFLGAFYLAQRLTWIAAREGVYSARITRLVRTLGWWLLAGEVVAAVIEAAARMSLLATLVTWRMDWTQWWVSLDVSVPIVISGVAVITFARILRLGVTMREDLEGTV